MLIAAVYFFAFLFLDALNFSFGALACELNLRFSIAVQTFLSLEVIPARFMVIVFTYYRTDVLRVPVQQRLQTQNDELQHIPSLKIKTFL